MGSASLVLRRNKVFVWDVTAFFASLWVAYGLRLGLGVELIAYSGQALALSLLAVLVKTATLAALGVFRVFWGHMAEREYLRLLAGSALGSALFGAVVFFAVLNPPYLVHFPRSVIAIDFLLATALLILGPKVLFRRTAGLS